MSCALRVDRYASAPCVTDSQRQADGDCDSRGVAEHGPIFLFGGGFWSRYDNNQLVTAERIHLFVAIELHANIEAVLVLVY